MIERRIEQFQSGKFHLTGEWDGPVGAGDTRCPGVIFCHGFTGNRIESRRISALLSRRLAESGVRTFRFDHRGCGESEGDFRDFTTEGLLEDLRHGLDIFQINPGVDHSKTAVVGYSLGGFSASYLMSLQPDFVTAALWAPVAQPEIIRDRLATYPGFEDYREKGYFDYMGFRVSAEYIDGIGTYDPVEWAKAFRSPVFFAQGAVDPVVKPEQVHRYLDARDNPDDQLLMFPDGDHFFATPDNIDRLIDETSEWLLRFLFA